MTALAIVAASVRPNNPQSRSEGVIAGAALTQGQVVYLNANKYYAASNVAAASALATAIVLTPSSGDGDLIQILKTGTEIYIGVTVSKGVQYYLGASGLIIPVADLSSTNYVTTIGIGGADKNLKLNIFASGEQLP